MSGNPFLPYQRFHRQEVISPNRKEIEQATALITTHGIARARFIVDFSFEEAQDTNYAPKFFGGILQYVPRALASFNKHTNMRQKEDAQKQDERFQHAYEAYRQREIERIKSTISPEDVSEMQASIRAELESEGTLPAMIGVGVSIRLHAQLEERAGIVPFDEWKKEQRRSSHGQTA